MSKSTRLASTSMILRASRPDPAVEAELDLLRAHVRELEAKLAARNTEAIEIPPFAARVLHGMLSLPFICFRIERDGTITESIGGGFKVLPVPPHSILGLNAYEIFPEVGDYIKRALEGETVYHESDGALAGTGWSALTYITYDETGGGAAVGVSLDITELRQTQANLRASEERYKLLAETAPIGIVRIDPQGFFQYVNAGFSELIGIPPHEAVGRHCLEWIHPDDRDRVWQEWNATLWSPGEPRRLTFRVPRPDGQPLWVICRGVEERDAQGDICGYIGTVTDIGEHKKVEQEIRRLNDDLNERVERRTAELRDANRELESFSYSVSHDLRTPLRSIDGFCYLIGEEFSDALGERGMSYVTRARTASQRMGRLIDDLLKMSRVSRCELKREKIDMTQLAVDVLKEIRETWMTDHAEVQIDQDLVCFGDPTLIHDVIANLLDNAWKFTSQTQNAVIHFGSGRLPSGQSVYFVRDNGAGFDAHYADKLFKPFERLHNSKEFEGSGIGLATVERIVRRHGGTVWAEGRPDSGATFYFTIPAPLTI
ncbi:MAG TPA: PAS domain S-box protein [Candidatus Binatia bacterium]|nr:PAS domain S-box protein [Candidatus Binatia bacterium]